MSNPMQAIERHVAAFAAKDAEAEPWSEDAELVTPVGQFRGREEVLGFLRTYWEGFPDARLEITSWIVDGSRAAGEGLMSGTHAGVLRTPDGEVPPTGRRVEIRWAAMYEVPGDEIASEHLYFDQMEFLSQLGLAPGAPAEATAT